MPQPVVGDTVNFYFQVSGEPKLRMRRATITKIYLADPEHPDGVAQPVFADLEVPFTEEEQVAWGYAPKQAHHSMAISRPKSGQWVHKGLLD